MIESLCANRVSDTHPGVSFDIRRSIHCAAASISSSKTRYALLPRNLVLISSLRDSFEREARSDNIRLVNPSHSFERDKPRNESCYQTAPTLKETSPDSEALGRHSAAVLGLDAVFYIKSVDQDAIRFEDAIDQLGFEILATGWHAVSGLSCVSWVYSVCSVVPESV